MGNTAVCALFVVDVWRSHRTVVFIDLGPNIMSFWWGFQNGKLWFQAVCLSCGKKWLSGYVSGYTHSVEMPNQLVYLKSWPSTVNITLLMLLHLHLSSSRTCTTCWILESFYLGKWGQKGRYGSIFASASGPLQKLNWFGKPEPSSSAVFLSWDKAKVCLSFEKTRRCTPPFDGRNCFQPRLHGQSGSVVNGLPL